MKKHIVKAKDLAVKYRVALAIGFLAFGSTLLLAIASGNLTPEQAKEAIKILAEMIGVII